MEGSVMTEHPENFSFHQFVDAGAQSFASKLARFAPYARALVDHGFVLREIAGPADRRVPVRHPATGEITEVIMLGSNNYLGLANEPYVIERAAEAMRRYGVGCGGPPLLNGTTSLHRELEARIARWKGCEEAMLFSSGYGANVGWITGLVGPGDAIVYDVQNHASVYDGIKLGRTRSAAFAHNDPEDLRRQLVRMQAQRPGATIVVCVEGVYSMDGDIAPLPELRAVCDEYDALLAVDDAHGTGVIGATGKGTAEHFDMEGQIDLVIGTFSKTFAVTGAFVAGRRDMIDYLRFFARPYMFSTSLPPVVVASVLAGMDVIEREPDRVRRLHDNVRYLVAGLRSAGLRVDCPTAILPIGVPQDIRIPEVVAALQREGVFVNGIEYPAVPKDRQRLRLSAMATLTRDDLDAAIAAIVKVGRAFGFVPLS
jgi:glycine C-acetyltransferase